MSKQRPEPVEGDPGTTSTSTTAPDSPANRGILFGLSAYGIWGLVPLFWNLVKSASALEILAMRMAWSLVFAIILALFTLPRGWLRAIATRRNLFMLAAAAVLVSINWGVYIWATTNGHVTEAALGYYINPIFSILVGVAFLKEQLRRYQWAAVGLAALAVIVLTVAYGKPPWIALTLAVSFGSYGLLKNLVRKGAVETLVIESAFMFAPAVAYVIYLQATGGLTFGHFGLVHSLLLAAGGLVTLIPLLLFAAAATRIPLSMIGLLQYITPTTQFLLGVLYFGERMPTGRWIGFGLVWAALIILSTGMLITLRRRRRQPTPVG
ncbi:EamA family transporter RarD [Microlunatus soli]|uniref:Chloramphenicol-sensitive protein RarD n=1 Tax=Microlunatus soli TaxID=630515 RepID=A0A1H1W645_9ACTN|nr:EamA family transporter RarD [Microlunatus soli]SDS92637.1 chloramphenicol-sensitive protein RarD [Microlunatus soli]